VPPELPTKPWMRARGSQRRPTQLGAAAAQGERRRPGEGLDLSPKRQDFLGSCAVTSRNALIHNVAKNGIKPPCFDAYRVPPCRSQMLGAEFGGSLATPNFRELLFFPRTRVNSVQ
jgi:hypothetical protein